MEVLERIIERCKTCKLNECINCEISWNEVQAIENVLNRFKYIEEENNRFMTGEIFSAKQLKLIEESQKKYFINKQKIREKIEELKPRIEQYEEYSKRRMETDVEFYENIADTAIVQILQDLLEENK